MDKVNSSQDLSAVFHSRLEVHSRRFAVMNEVEAAVHGDLPDRYGPLFAEPEKEVRIELRTIKTADQDLTALTSKVFPIMVQPKTLSEANKKDASRVEQVAYGYNNGAALRGTIEMDAIMFQLAQHQVRFADGCLVAYPDYERKLIFFHVVDPRNHLPPVGWNPFSPSPLDDTMICYELPLGEVKRRFPNSAVALDKQYARSSHGPGGHRIPDDMQRVRFAMTFSADSWYASTISHDRTVTLNESHTGDKGHPGVCPVTSFQQFGSDPLFTGQIGIEVALQKVMSQELRGTEQMLTGPIFVSGLEGDINWTGVNKLSTLGGEKPMVQRLGPTSPLNTERVLASLVNFARIFNRNPESFQGAGDANSAKAVQTLQAGVRSTVQDILWMPFMNGFPRVYDNCMKMERNLWPNERKTIQGKKGRASFEVDYVPGVHLDGYEGRVKIEPGFGLGGIQQSIEAIQKNGAGMLSKRTAIEYDPGVADVDEEMRRIQSEEMGEVLTGIMAAKGPELSITAVAAVIEKINKGMDKVAAIREVSEEGLFDPPAPEPEMPGLPPGLPALPPGMMEEAMGSLPPAGMVA